MSVWGWVLVGLATWLAVAVVLALVIGHFVRPDRVTTLDLLRARHLDELGSQREEQDQEQDQEQDNAPGSTTDADLPAPRDGGHDDAAAPVRRRRNP